MTLLAVRDRVEEYAHNVGLADVDLLGATRQDLVTFADAGLNGLTVPYVIRHRILPLWEVGVGTVVGDTVLTRDLVLANSSGTTSKINFLAGTVDVINTLAAAKAVLLDADSDDLHLPGALAVAGALAVTGAATAASFAGVGSGLTALNMDNASSGVLAGARGGTGVSNTGKTLTLAGNLATVGAFALTFTLAGATDVTLPTSGTLATVAQYQAGDAATLASANAYADTKVASVAGTTDRITIGGTSTAPVITIAATYPGQTSIVTLGTVLTGVWQGTQIADTYLATIATAGKVSNSATTATSANTASAIVARDSSNNFSAGTITATFTGDLTGNAATATALATPRTIWGQSFNGTANVTGALSGATTGEFTGPVTVGTIPAGWVGAAANANLRVGGGIFGIGTGQGNYLVSQGADDETIGLGVEGWSTAGNTTTLWGGYAYARHDSTGTLGTLLGWNVEVAKSGGAGVVTTAIGLNVSDVTAGVTNYAIRTGAGLVQFGGLTTFNAGATVASGQTLTLSSATVAGAPTWSSTQTLNTSGTAALATQAVAWQTARTISITGDGAYTSGSLDGSANVTGVLTLTTVNGNIGSFGGASAIPVFTVNAKGLVTGVTTTTIVAPAGALTGTILYATLPTNNGSWDTGVGTTITITRALTVSGALTGTLTGNASTATALATPRTLWGVSFDGTANVTAEPTFGAGVTVSSGQTLTLTGATVAGSPTWSGAQTIPTLTVGTSLVLTGATITGAPTWSNTQTLNTSGNAATATALATGRTISITGDLAYTSPSFDGSGNVTAAGTLAAVNGNVGSFGSSTAIPVFTVNAKGLITAASTAVVVAPAGTLSGNTLAAGVTASSLTSVGTLTSLTLSGAITGATTYSGTDNLSITKATSAGTIVTMSAGSQYPYHRLVTPNRSWWIGAIDNGADAPFQIGVGNTVGTTPAISINGGDRVVTFSAGVTGTTAAFSGTVTQTKTGNVVAWSGATTQAQYFEQQSTGAHLVWGVESSAGATILTGAAAYSSFFFNVGATALYLGTNNTIGMTMHQTTQAVTFAAGISATSADFSSAISITGGNPTNRTNALTIEQNGIASRLRAYGSDSSTPGTFTISCASNNGSVAENVAIFSFVSGKTILVMIPPTSAAGLATGTLWNNGGVASFA